MLSPMARERASATTIAFAGVIELAIRGGCDVRGIEINQMATRLNAMRAVAG